MIQDLSFFKQTILLSEKRTDRNTGRSESRNNYLLESTRCAGTYILTAKEDNIKERENFGGNHGITDGQTDVQLEIVF